VGLEPACVVVCPEHAILAGDLSDPASEIARTLATAQVIVRKPEQGTGPKLFYINGNDWSLHPTASPAAESYMWADRITEQNVATYWLPVISGGSGNGQIPNGLAAPALALTRSKSGTPIRRPREQGRPLNGPIQIGGRVAEHMVQTAYNAQHKIQWHWELPAYLVTKNIAGGLVMLLGLANLLRGVGFGSLTFLTVAFTALMFTLMTVLLLVKDLSQPKRFFLILLRPQWQSWVARGAFVLIGFTIVTGLWWLLEAGAYSGSLAGSPSATLRQILAPLAFLLALGTVSYSAFLLGQAEGRDMWQSNLLPFQLFAQSMMVASGVFLALGAFVPLPLGLSRFLDLVFPASIAANLLLTLAATFLMPSASEVALLGSREMTHGHYRRHFWWGGITLAHIIPLALFLLLPATIAIAALAAAIGLFFYEYAFVMAPQRIPNS
jgi:hypothetical protein